MLILAVRVVLGLRSGARLADIVRGTWVGSRRLPLCFLFAAVGHLYSLVIFQRQPLEPTPGLVFSFTVVMTAAQLSVIEAGERWKGALMASMVLVLSAAGSFVVTLP